MGRLQNSLQSEKLHSIKLGKELETQRSLTSAPSLLTKPEETPTQTGFYPGLAGLGSGLGSGWSVGPGDLLGLRGLAPTMTSPASAWPSSGGSGRVSPATATWGASQPASSSTWGPVSSSVAGGWGESSGGQAAGWGDQSAATKVGTLSLVCELPSWGHLSQSVNRKLYRVFALSIL